MKTKQQSDELQESGMVDFLIQAADQREDLSVFLCLRMLQGVSGCPRVTQGVPANTLLQWYLVVKL